MRASDDNPPPRPGEPKRSELRRILDEKPQEEKRIGRAVAALGLATVVAIAALGLLLIWHLSRRARLIRERLGRPKDSRLTDPLAAPTDEFPLPRPESNRQS